MEKQLRTEAEQERIAAGLPFVEALARRLAASMPNSIDVGDLVQDGMIGLIDATSRFDEKRGIKFETFAERRVRGAMIDALRKDAWPRGVRRVRRELDAAREKLRQNKGMNHHWLILPNIWVLMKLDSVEQSSESRPSNQHLHLQQKLSMVQIFLRCWSRLNRLPRTKLVKSVR